MTTKIDYAALREDIRRQYAEWPANGDPVLEFEGRAAEVLADLSVFILKEAEERQTPIPTILQGLSAMFATPIENICSNVGIDRVAAVHIVANHLAAYVIQEADVQPDSVAIPRRDVGDI